MESKVKPVLSVNEKVRFLWVKMNIFHGNAVIIKNGLKGNNGKNENENKKHKK
jgi:hypothetical protein